MSVNGGQLPTSSLSAPCLVGKIFFCTFADVEERQFLIPQRPRGEDTGTILNFYSNMAKSKSGGTRSYLRGRIANDVYSIGKDSKGAKQQVVRSLAEQVANPQTVSQMRGRMIMSTIMQAVSAMSQIIDHSFDSVPTGQPSISEFIRLNYALIKADVAAHPASGNSFGLSEYQEKGIQAGAYQVSAGKNTFPKALTADWTKEWLGVYVGGESVTKADIISALGLGDGSYVTILAIGADKTFAFVRLHNNTGLADDTEVTAANVENCFTIENPLDADVTISLEGTGAARVLGLNVTAAGSAGLNKAIGAIRSTPNNGGWVRTTSFLQQNIQGTDAADAVLPTYPEGSQRFLNGGEL